MKRAADDAPKPAEIPIRRYQRMLERAEQLGAMGSWHWEVATDTLTWSAELYRIYGIEPGTLLTYESFLERVHPDDRPRVKTLVATVLEERQPLRYQERIVRPDGTVRLLDSQADVDVDDGGRPVALFGLCRDVTDETRAQAELREREQRFATIFHASPVATVLTAAADGRVLDVNARFLEITGYRQDELIGRSVESLGIWRAEERHRMLDQLREQGSLREVALTYRTRAGLECRALAAIERLEIGGEDCLLKLLWRT